MAEFRAEKSGFAKDVQNKLASQYDASLAAKCLAWIGQLELRPNAQVSEPIRAAGQSVRAKYGATGDGGSASPEELHAALQDGLALGYLMAALAGPTEHACVAALTNKSWSETNKAVFEPSRRRERIAAFSRFAAEWGGVDSANQFQTDELYERTNLNQVCVCVYSLGIEAQAKPGYAGPAGFWPTKHQKNARNFTEEQLRQGQSVISGQMGYTGGANASGVSFGARRHINDSH